MLDTMEMKVARLEEQMKSSAEKLDTLLLEIRHFNKMQVIIDRNNREFPKLENTLNELLLEVDELRRYLGSTRAFAMGASAAFGFIGAVLAFLLKIVW